MCTRGVQQGLLVCHRHGSGKKVNKDGDSFLERQSRHFASKGASNRSLPHAAQEYFRILIAHLVCCCHMAFISIPSTQWGVKGPDAMSSSILYPSLSYRQISLLPQSSDVMFKFIVTFKCGLITLRSDLNDQSEGFILLTEWVPHP